MELEDKFEEILDEFDFRKVHKVMEQLNWRWSFLEGRFEVPKISEMKKECRRLFYSVIEAIAENNSKEENLSCGGFTVTVYDNETVYLQFVLEEELSE